MDLCLTWVDRIATSVKCDFSGCLLYVAEGTRTRTKTKKENFVVGLLPFLLIKYIMGNVFLFLSMDDKHF